MDIISTLSALKQSFDLIKSAIEFNDIAKIKSASADFNDKYIALQNSTLEVQNQIALLHQERSELQKSLLRLEDKLSEIECYELHEIKNGIFVYKYSKDDKPIHYVCQNCFDHNIKSVLRLSQKSGYGTSYTCAENENHKIYL